MLSIGILFDFLIDFTEVLSGDDGGVATSCLHFLVTASIGKTPLPMDKATSLSAWHTPPLVKDAKAIGEYPIHYYLSSPP
jgi:hypothetical protein